MERVILGSAVLITVAITFAGGDIARAIKDAAEILNSIDDQLRRMGP